ncbi:putative inorganic phosphate cotransporter [Copidosoma floridanum]|uniref:putative inorganic phosphate cotransporter n=1 Tax=Copidosoma floridanum TaxID=29053 RepID=UPI0006C98DDA|nr:putative inorganic phosphate cotransporter [Copidosoma floridanum]
MSHTGRRVSRVSLAENMKLSPEKPKAAIGARHIQALMMMVGFLCCYAMRVTMSVALVVMTDKKKPESYDWEAPIPGFILSSFFFGYGITQIPGSMAAHRWGAARFLGPMIGICGLVTIAIPAAARYGDYPLVITCRVLSGFCQGVVTPTLHTLLAKWTPLPERGRFTTFVYSGGWVGNVAALQSSGVLSASSIGWPSCFYFWGGASLVWTAVWYLFGRESPAEHPNIPLDEKLYIESSLGVVETDEPVSTPWRSILTSVPVWALLVTQCTQAWGFWMLLTKIPAYMNDVLNYDILSNGFMSSLPYLTAWLVSFPVSIVSDWAIRTGKVSTRASRFFCNTFGEILPAAALVCLAFVENDQILAVVILIIAVACNIAVYCGHHANHMDLSPNFAGPLMGLTNAAATLCSILAPIAHDFIVTEKTSLSQWRTIFFMTAVFYIIGANVFVFCGSVKTQPWNDPIKTRKNSRTYGIPEVIGSELPKELKKINEIKEEVSDEKEEKIER